MHCCRDMVRTSFENWISLDWLKLHSQLNSLQPVTSELSYAPIILHGIRMSKIGLMGFVIGLVLRSFRHEMLWTAKTNNRDFSTLKISILLVRHGMSSKLSTFVRMDPLYAVISLWATDCPINLCLLGLFPRTQSVSFHDGLCSKQCCWRFRERILPKLGEVVR